VTFFVASAVLTRSGQPGASTPVPWMASHALWVVATAFATLGVTTLVRRSALGEGVAGWLAAGAFGLGTLHALQWTAWVYVDVVAYGQGAHAALFDPLLHPFGTAHALMYGALVGTGVASLGWALARASAARRALAYAGVAVGVVAVLAAATALVTVAPTRSPASLATIVLQALAYGWLLVAGVALHRTSTGEGTPS
jgi:hypothetical protein